MVGCVGRSNSWLVNVNDRQGEFAMPGIIITKVHHARLRMKLL
jgi:hypothetical protein